MLKRRGAMERETISSMVCTLESGRLGSISFKIERKLGVNAVGFPAVCTANCTKSGPEP